MEDRPRVRAKRTGCIQLLDGVVDPARELVVGDRIAGQFAAVGGYLMLRGLPAIAEIVRIRSTVRLMRPRSSTSGDR